jgi:hypothetical protein
VVTATLLVGDLLRINLHRANALLLVSGRTERCRGRSIPVISSCVDRWMHRMGNLAHEKGVWHRQNAGYIRRTAMMEAIDLIEIEPGIYGVEPIDPHAHQWKAFWRMLIVLTIGIAVSVSLDLMLS